MKLPGDFPHPLIPRLAVLLAAGTCFAQEEAGDLASSGMVGLLYFDDWQVEKEFAVNPLVVQQWTELGLTRDSRLDAAAREKLKPGISSFLAGRCPVTIDGKPVRFELERVSFVEPDPGDFVPIGKDAVVSPAEMMASVTFTAPLPGLDDEISISWDLFPEDGSPVQFIVADAVSTRNYRLTPGEPVLAVRGRFPEGARTVPAPPPPPPVMKLQIPWLSVLLLLLAVVPVARVIKGRKRPAVTILLILVCAGGAFAVRNLAPISVSRPGTGSDALDDKGLRLVVDRLLRGVYHAFDFRDEETQYDVLSKVAGGETLTEIYLEVRRTLETREQDGSRARIKELAVTEAIPLPLEGRRGFAVESTWEALGRVGHWGHFHDRLNRYRAKLVIESVDGSWKLTGMELLEQERNVEGP